MSASCELGLVSLLVNVHVEYLDKLSFVLLRSRIPIIHIESSIIKSG